MYYFFLTNEKANQLLLNVGIFLSIGPIIDEVQVFEHMNSRKCAKARQLLMILWLFAAFTITVSYKEVHVAKLVDVGYADKIDTLQDLVRSGRKIASCGNCAYTSLIYNDPRESVQQFVKDDKIALFNLTTTNLTVPSWIIQE